MNKLNSLYKIWVSQPTQSNLGVLLQAVRTRTSKRYARVVEDNTGNIGPLDSGYADIASETMIRVWRALPGYPGEDALKQYEDRSKFASYVRTVANGIRKDFAKLADNRHVSHYDPIDMEYIQAGLEQGHESPEPPDFWSDEE